MQQSVIDALPVAIAILSGDGAIVRVNDSWQRFEREIEGFLAVYGQGADDVAACAAEDNPTAVRLAEGVRAVLEGRLPDFSLEYACGTAAERRWLLYTVRRLTDGRGALVRQVPIDELKSLEARLVAEQESNRAARSELWQAVDAMSEGFAIYDSDAVLIHSNSRYREIYAPIAERIRPGLPFAELLRLGIGEGLFPEAQGREEDWVAERVRGLREGESEVERRLRDNRWVRVRIRSMEGGLKVAVVTDISETKHREAELRASEARFRDFADAGAERFWEMDAALRFISFKMPSDDDSGMSGEDLLGRRLHDIAEADGDPDGRLAAHIADLEAQRPFRNFRFSMTDPGGRVRHFRSSGVPVFDEDLAFVGFRGVLTDETVLVEARLRAERAEAYLRGAVESAPYGFVIRDADDRLMLCNATYKELCHLDDDMVRPGASFEASLRAGLARGDYPDAVGCDPEAWLAERMRRHRQPSGPWEQRIAERSILVDDRLLPDGGVVGTRIDVTDVKRSAERAMESERLQSLGTLAGGIAHDFNNLLAAMLGYSELVLDEPALTADARDCLENVLSAGARARDLIKQILRFSRLSDDGEVELCRLDEVAQEVVLLVRPTIHPDVALAIEVRTVETAVLAVPGQLSQIAMNLTVNAAQAIGERPGRIDVSVEAVTVEPAFAERHPPLTAGRCVCLSVRDDGPGIDAATLKRIFEPFFTTKEVGQGTGMGLSVVHGIVARYDGAVVVESEPGRGTEFRVYLPLAEQTAIPVPGAVPSLAVPDGPRGRALVVDDDPSVRRALAGLLGRLGYRSFEVERAESALALLQDRDQSFALLVTDQVMPAMHGDELAAAARRLHPDLPVLLCTGFGHGLDQDRLAALGRTAMLVKPFTLRELGAALSGLETAA